MHRRLVKATEISYEGSVAEFLAKGGGGDCGKVKKDFLMYV